MGNRVSDRNRNASPSITHSHNYGSTRLLSLLSSSSLATHDTTCDCVPLFPPFFRLFECLSVFPVHSFSRTTELDHKDCNSNETSHQKVKFLSILVFSLLDVVVVVYVRDTREKLLMNRR